MSAKSTETTATESMWGQPDGREGREGSGDKSHTARMYRPAGVALAVVLIAAAVGFLFFDGRGASTGVATTGTTSPAFAVSISAESADGDGDRAREIVEALKTKSAAQREERERLDAEYITAVLAAEAAADAEYITAVLAAEAERVEQERLAIEAASVASPVAPAPVPSSAPVGDVFTGGGSNGLPSDSYWDGMAQCETAGNWAHFPNGTWTGGLGIYNQTWLGWGGGEFAPKAGQATREQQIIVANRIATQGYGGQGPVGYSAWGCVSAVGYP